MMMMMMTVVDIVISPPPPPPPNRQTQLTKVLAAISVHEPSASNKSTQMHARVLM